MRNRLEIIRQLCRDKVVLNIGCVGKVNAYKNPLWLHGQIAEVAKRVIGIDINLKDLLQLSHKYEVILANAEAFHFSIKFDVIVAGEIIEHLSDLKSFLRCVRNNIKDDGKLIITTPNICSPLSFKREVLDKKQPSGHVCGFTPILLRNLLESNGWDIERLELLAPEDYSLRKFFGVLLPSFLQHRILAVASPRQKRFKSTECLIWALPVSAKARKEHGGNS